MYAVICFYSFDPERKCFLYKTKKEAEIKLYNEWNNYLAEERLCNTDIDDNFTTIYDDCGIVVYQDGDFVQWDVVEVEDMRKETNNV